MSETIEQTWEQELLARGEARGEARGQLRAYRENLRELLEERFGPLPEGVIRQIQEKALQKLRAFEASAHQGAGRSIDTTGRSVRIDTCPR